MTAHERSAAKIAASIDVLRRQFGMGAASSIDIIEQIWPEMVGVEIATMTRVAELRNGTLVVDAGDPATAQALGLVKMRVLETLRARCSGETISDLNVRVRRLRE